MQVAQYRDFTHALRALWKRGGRHQKAATQIDAMLGRVTRGETDPLHGLRTTKHGESRLRNCVKYDLNDACRLVTVQREGYCILLYCGDHEDCDRWLDSNRGLVPVVDGNMVVRATFVSDEGDTPIAFPVSRSVGKLYQLLSEDHFDALVAGLSRKTVRALEGFESTVTDAELWMTLAEVEDTVRRMTIYDVLTLLRTERVPEAIDRVRILTGEVVEFAKVEAELLPEVIDSETIKRIPTSSPQYAEAMKRFMTSASYRDWMLFMNAEQEAIVQEDFAGPAKLVGVSGSGKTCVVVRRAIRLAEMYPYERILVLTLNRALAKLIEDLVDTCAPVEVRPRIDVRPFFDVCRDLMLQFDPRGAKRYQEVSWKLREHVDEIWTEYYECENNNFDARVLQEVHDHLLARGWHPGRYIREEIDWLRSALAPSERQDYLAIERVGRTVSLQRQYRERILEGAAGWEEKMAVVGVIDALGIAQSLSKHLGRIQPEYRCVLVDEVQDFGNLELRIVRSLAAPDENDLFLCGDAAQAVSTKHQSLREIGIAIPPARSRHLTRNYRNSRDILTAAYRVLSNNITEEMIDREDFAIRDPEFSTFSGSTPLLLGASDLQAELKAAFVLTRELVSQRPEAKACIAICGYSLYELTNFGDELSIPVLNGATNLDAGGVFISDLEQTKGFEFDVMCVINCSGGVLPDGAAPADEQFRDLSRLYVAMTRAKSDLILSWSGEPSSFLNGAEDTLLSASWEDYVEVASAPSVSTPRHLDAERVQQARNAWRTMTGEQFLFTEWALGVSTDLSAKLRSLVDGQGVRKAKQVVKFRNMGSAVRAFTAEPRSKQLWGPEGANQFAFLASRLPNSEGPANS